MRVHMRKHCLVNKLAIVALLVIPACGEEAADGDGTPADRLGTEESALSSAVSLCPPGTPAALAPPDDQHVTLVLDASGVQKYACTGTAAGAAWTLVAPAADLFASECHYVVGEHYEGPTWRYIDGSTVVGERVAGATVDPTAIPWLLLAVTSHGGSHGKLTRVTAIQRLATIGGNPPADGCDAEHLGAKVEVPYTAKYFFYRTRPDNPYNRRCGGPG